MHFIADNTLGRLRRWMSLLGYDVVYDPRSVRQILAHPSAGEFGEMVVLGRCPSLAVSTSSPSETPCATPRFYHVADPELPGQLAQVVRAFPLDFARTAFSRCAHCNTSLKGPLPLGHIANANDPDRGVPPMVQQWRRLYWQCPACYRVYWEGTHTAHVRECVLEWTGLALPAPPEQENGGLPDR